MATSLFSWLTYLNHHSSITYQLNTQQQKSALCLLCTLSNNVVNTRYISRHPTHQTNTKLVYYHTIQVPCQRNLPKTSPRVAMYPPGKQHRRLTGANQEAKKFSLGLPEMLLQQAPCVSPAQGAAECTECKYVLGTVIRHSQGHNDGANVDHLIFCTGRG